MSEIKLLPCPFCGGEATVNTVEPHKHAFATWMPDYTGGTFIECNNCSCAISGETEEEAIKTWNTRKPMQEIVEMLEELFKHHNATKTVKRLVLEVVKNVGGMKLGVLLKPKQHELKILEMFLHKQCDLERTKFAYSQEEVWNAVKKATEALEKQIPKKVLIGKNMMTKEFAKYCPNCGTILCCDWNYCFECGQALYWTGEGE